MRARTAILAALCATSVGLLGASNSARASLVLSGGNVHDSFTDIGAQGFGNAPRLLTVQATGTSTVEAGKIDLSTGVATDVAFAGDTFAARNDVPNPCCTDVNKASAPSLSAVGWATGADVAIGLNTGEAGTDITLENVVLYLWNAANQVVGTFALGPNEINFSATELARQQGNGNAIFKFVLDAAQQTAFNIALGVNPDLSTFHITLASAFRDVTDGPESWLAVLGPGAVIPIPGALVLFASGLVGVAALNRRRRSRNTMETAIAA
jgi:hypothetical protein